MESKVAGIHSACAIAGNISNSTRLSWKVIIQKLTLGDNFWEQAPECWPQVIWWQHSMRKQNLLYLLPPLQDAPKDEMQVSWVFTQNQVAAHTPKMVQMKTNGLFYFETSCQFMAKESGHFTCWIHCLRWAERQPNRLWKNVLWNRKPTGSFFPIY